MHFKCHLQKSTILFQPQYAYGNKARNQYLSAIVFEAMFPQTQAAPLKDKHNTKNTSRCLPWTFWKMF